MNHFGNMIKLWWGKKNANKQRYGRYGLCTPLYINAIYMQDTTTPRDSTTSIEWEWKNLFISTFVLLSFLIVFYCMPFFYSDMLFPVVLKVQISKNGDNLWQVLYIRSFLFKAFDKHLGSMKRYVFFKVHYLKRSLRK